MFKKILVPLDGSELSEKALPYAAEVARKFGARLWLLRCMVLPEPVLVGLDMAIPDHYADLQMMERKAVEKYLEEARSRPEVTDLVEGVIVPFGNPGESILEHAQSDKCDLIVMSSHGRSGLRRFVYGSVAEKVLHHTPCPLLLVRVSEG